VSQRWGDRLLDLHGFRQTQTAISVYYMLAGSNALAYETPVLGPPWSIPFEFPLYQWIVALVAGTKWIALDQAGRLVSVVFFLLTLIPGYTLLGTLRIPARIRPAILALVLVSPFYIFWSRTFLIESTGLFLSVSYTALVVRFLRVPCASNALIAVVFGALAAMVKVTTYVPWFLAASGFVIHDLIRPDSAIRSTPGLIRRLLALALMAAIPMVLLEGWTSFADRHKELSTLGTHVKSSALNVWNFGTLEQKLDRETWRIILSRTPTTLGSQWVIVAAALCAVLSRRRLVAFLTCIALYLSGPLIFTNLYFVHDYYSFANQFFLYAAIGVAIVSLVEAGALFRVGAIVGVLVMIAISVESYRENPIIGPNRALATEMSRIADTVRGLTKPDEVIVLMGFDWSPEIPYYSQRRALMLPRWKELKGDNNEMGRAIMSLKGLKIGALILSTVEPGPISADQLKNALAALGFKSRSRPVEAPFQLYLPEASVERDQVSRF
jgi:hypothetical protein